MENEELAFRLCDAIRKLGNSEDNLNNFESYLCSHFDKWFKKFVVSPGGLVEEFETFTNMTWD